MWETSISDEHRARSEGPGSNRANQCMPVSSEIQCLTITNWYNLYAGLYQLQEKRKTFVFCEVLRLKKGITRSMKKETKRQVMNRDQSAARLITGDGHSNTYPINVKHTCHRAPLQTQQNAWQSIDFAHESAKSADTTTAVSVRRYATSIPRSHPSLYPSEAAENPLLNATIECNTQFCTSISHLSVVAFLRHGGTAATSETMLAFSLLSSLFFQFLARLPAICHERYAVYLGWKTAEKLCYTRHGCMRMSADACYTTAQRGWMEASCPSAAAMATSSTDSRAEWMPTLPYNCHIRSA